MPNEINTKLARLLHKRREQLGLSISEIARRAQIDKGTLSLLERGLIQKPSPENLRAIGQALDMPVSELFTAADYMHSNDLPPLRPYMRSKYHDLPPDAIAEVERFVDDLTRRYGLSTPRDHEDEQQRKEETCKQPAPHKNRGACSRRCALNCHSATRHSQRHSG